MVLLVVIMLFKVTESGLLSGWYVILGGCYVCYYVVVKMLLGGCYGIAHDW